MPFISQHFRLWFWLRLGGVVNALVAFDLAAVTQPVVNVSWFSVGVLIFTLIMAANWVLAYPTNLVGTFWVGVTGQSQVIHDSFLPPPLGGLQFLGASVQGRLVARW